MTTATMIVGSALDGSNAVSPYNWDAVSGTRATVVAGKYELNAAGAGAGAFQAGPTYGSAVIRPWGGMFVKMLIRMEWEPTATPGAQIGLGAFGAMGCFVDTARKLKVIGLSGGSAVAAAASSLANHKVEVELWFDGSGLPRLIRVYEDTMTLGNHVVQQIDTHAGAYLTLPSGATFVGGGDAKQAGRQVIDNVEYLAIPSDN